ncbi:MAG TPA: SIMPL domain-containing protein [Verrucomicrobiae bacterium]|nr:SIMPL domain-containing protein [Verrucomicrobiae bacterium]
MNKLSVVLLGSLLASNLIAEPELKGSASELAGYLAAVPKLVSVAGEAEVKTNADRAIISLSVVTENKSLHDAVRLNQEVRSKIVKRLKDADIAPERIQASKFSSTPKYGIFSEKAKSYRVENTLRITALDEKEFQAAASQVDGVAEVRYAGIDFEHSDKEGLKTKALTQALANATAKKKVYEDQLGVKLTPRGFSTSAVAEKSPLQRRYLESGTYEFKSGVSSRLTTPIPSGQTQNPEMEELLSVFGELIFTVHVAVEYAVESR